MRLVAGGIGRRGAVSGRPAGLRGEEMTRIELTDQELHVLLALLRNLQGTNKTWLGPTLTPIRQKLERALVPPETEAELRDAALVPTCLDHNPNGGPGSDQCMNCGEYATSDRPQAAAVAPESESELREAYGGR
jgi:hypothetical protein